MSTIFKWGVFMVGMLAMSGFLPPLVYDLSLQSGTQHAHSLEMRELSHPAPPGYRFQHGFQPQGFERPESRDLRPNLEKYPKNMSNILQEFLEIPLNHHPAKANFLSEKLESSQEVIREAQRLHFNIIGNELKKLSYAILIDFAAFENKGDPCITVGEMYFLARLGIKVIYSCSATRCTDSTLKKARDLADHYSPEDLVILVHGGGNIIGYAFADIVRFKVNELFSGFRILVFPQSIWVRSFTHPHVNRTVQSYCCNRNLTIVLRDALSYSIAQKLYKGATRLIMAPDMAFQFGHVPRFMSPVFDIMWIKRKDGETPGYQLPTKVPKDVKVHISDWWQWKTPASNDNLERAFYIATNGFFFLQRGRVVITDRLHGHILSTLMDIPHVLIDNKAKKLSSYHNTWTRSLTNTVITDDPSKALGLAIQLLKKYNDTLPPRVTFPDLDESFKHRKLGVPDSSYP